MGKAKTSKASDTSDGIKAEPLPYDVLPDADPSPNPALFTSERCGAICQSISNGASKEASARAAGISKSTFYAWVSASPGFSDAVDEADAGKETHCVSVIRSATEGGALLERRTETRRDGCEVVWEKFSAPQWQAAAWLLERTVSERYRQKSDTNIGGQKDGVPVDLNISAEELTDAQLAAIAIGGSKGAAKAAGSTAVTR